MGLSLSTELPAVEFDATPGTTEDPIGERVASNLLRLRAKRNLSLDGLARLCGVSRTMLAQIESDEPAAAETHVLVPELVVRQSSGAGGPVRAVPVGKKKKI